MIQTHFSGMTEPAARVAPGINRQKAAAPSLPETADSVQFGGRPGKGFVRKSMAGLMLAIAAPLGLLATASPAAADPLEPWEIEQLEGRVDQLETTQGQHTESLSKLEGRIIEAEKQMQTYTSGLQQVRDLLDLDGDSSEADQKVEERLTALETKVNEINTQQEGLPKAEDLTALRTGQEDLKKQVVALQEAGKLTNEQANTIKTALDKQLADLNTKMDAANEQVQETRDQIVAEASQQVRSSQEWKLLTGLAVGGGLIGTLGLLTAMAALSKSKKNGGGGTQKTQLPYQTQQYEPAPYRPAPAARPAQPTDVTQQIPTVQE